MSLQKTKLLKMLKLSVINKIYLEMGLSMYSQQGIKIGVGMTEEEVVVMEIEIDIRMNKTMKTIQNYS